MSDFERIDRPPALPPRPLEGHKGTFGRVLIVGGNDEMIGAPVFAGTAALRMGAGLVQIAVPKTILPAALSITPELIGLGLATARDEKRLLEAAEKADGIVIGPGLGQSAAAKKRLMRLIQLKKPVVLDADALNLLAARKAWPKTFKANAILTPHPGEMSRLTQLLGRDVPKTIPTTDDARITLATKAAKTFRQVILLKGERTVVTDGHRVYVNHTGNSALAKAGTGDVLSGIIGTLLAQQLDPFDAACIAAHLHGRAGEVAGEEWGMRSVLARDVIVALVDALGEC